MAGGSPATSRWRIAAAAASDPTAWHIGMRARSSLVRPDLRPASTSSWATQLRSVWSETPRSLAIWAIVSPELFARRTASARNSGGYGGCERGTWTPSWEPSAPSGQVSTKAGQVQLAIPFDFRSPPFTVRLGQRTVLGAAVPKAPIDEDRDLSRAGRPRRLSAVGLLRPRSSAGSGDRAGANADRKAVSGAVSCRRTICMRRRAAGDDAAGASARALAHVVSGDLIRESYRVRGRLSGDPRRRRR